MFGVLDYCTARLMYGCLGMVHMASIYHVS